MFTLFREPEYLADVQQKFNKYRTYFITRYDSRVHVSDLQIHKHKGDKYVSIAPWAQFLPTIIPPADYLLIAYTDGEMHHVHIAKRTDILSIVRHFGYRESKSPVHHIVLPHIIDQRWRNRILSVSVKVDSEGF